MNKPNTAHRRRAGLLLLVAALAGCSNLCPREAPPPPPHRPHDGPPRDPAFGEAMHACMEELGVARPAPPKDPSERPALPDREALDACLKRKGVQPPPGPWRDPDFAAALEACRTTLDLPAGHGPPSPEVRERIDACLKEKGIAVRPPPADLPPPPPPPRQ